MMEAQTVRQALGQWENGEGALYEQLAAGLRTLVERGDLPPGIRLPPERRLAREVGVSRGTVVAALDLLRAAGLVRSRQGSGSVVVGAAPPVRHGGDLVMSSMVALNVAAGRPAADGFIDLQPGAWASADGLPTDVFEPGPDLDAVLATHGYAPAGLPMLRAAIANYLTEDRGLSTTPDQILVTTGGHQAIALLVRSVAGPGDSIALEALTYPGAKDIARATGARVVTARLSATGVDVADLESVVAAERPRLVYLVPTAHNPTGTVLPVEQRERLVAAAAAWDAIVIDDESLAETLHDGDAPPPLAALARGAESVSRVFTVGSASKSFWGGLRVGWIRGPEPAIAALSRLKTVADLACPALSQVVTARLLERRHEILPRRRRTLAENFAAVAGALTDRLPEWRWQRPAGGLALWVQLPGTDAARFAEVALRHGVGVLPGTVSSAAGGAHDRLRLALGQPPEVLVEGVVRLADAWSVFRHGDAVVSANVTV